jgi:hypothetical protein
MEKLNIDAETAKLADLLADASQKLRSGQLTLDQLEVFLKEVFSKFIPIQEVPTVLETSKKENKVIKIMHTLKLDAVNGRETISSSKKLFAQISRDLSFLTERMEIDRTSLECQLKDKTKETPEVEIEFCEIKEFPLLKEIFASVSDDLSKLCLTQHQFINFIIKYKNLIKSGDQIFFLLTENIYASMRAESVGFCIEIKQLREGSYVGYCGRHHCILYQKILIEAK